MKIIKLNGKKPCNWCMNPAIGMATVGEGTDHINVCEKHAASSNVHLV